MTRTLFGAAILLLCFGCGAPETSEVLEVVKETVDAARPKERIVIQVRLEQSAMPSAEDLAVRQRIEEQIGEGRAGRVVSSGGGVGYFDITVEVESTADAIPKVEALLRENRLQERTTIRILGRSEK